MLPKWHVLYGVVFSLLLVYFFHFSLFAGFIVFLSSVFIDLDHVLIYFIKTKNLNPLKFFDWSYKRKAKWGSLRNSEREKLKFPQFVFHGIEFVLILILLSFFHPFFLWMLIGILFHLVLDFIVIFYEKEHISIKLSQIWVWQRNKNKEELDLL